MTFSKEHAEYSRDSLDEDGIGNRFYKQFISEFSDLTLAEAKVKLNKRRKL